MYDANWYGWTFLVTCILLPIIVNMVYYHGVNDPRLASKLSWLGLFWFPVYLAVSAIQFLFVDMKFEELYPDVSVATDLLLYLFILGLYSLLIYFLTALGIKLKSTNCKNVPF